MFVCLSLHAGKISSALGGQGGFNEPPQNLVGQETVQKEK